MKLPIITLPQPRWLSGMALALLALMYGSLALSLFIPIYYDDVLTDLVISRIGYDGGDVTINIAAHCGYDVFAVHVPWLLLPGRWLSWAMHALEPNYIWMRLQTLAVVFAWLILVYQLVRLCFWKLPRLHVAAITAALGGIGILPFLLIQGRPEPGLLLVISGFVLLPLRARTAPLSTLSKSSCILLALLGASWAISAHPKIYFYAPLFLLSFWLLPFRSRLTNVGLCSLIAAMYAQAWPYWQLRMLCPEAPGENSFRLKQALSVSQLTGDPLTFIHSFISNLLNMDMYADPVFFHATTRFLPQIGMNPWLYGVNGLLMLGLLGGIGLIGWAFYICIHRRNAYALLLLCLIAGFFAQGGIQTAKYFYEAGLAVGIFLLMGLLSATQLRWVEMLRSRAQPAIGGLIGLAIISQISLLAFYGPAVVRTLQHATPAGYIAYNQLSPLHSEATQELVQQAATTCGIAPDDSSRHVVIDGKTYYAMRHTYQPFYINAVTSQHTGEKGIDFLRKWQSSGLVTMCSALTKDLLKIAHRSREICCIGPRTIYPADEDDLFIPDRWLENTDLFP